MALKPDIEELLKWLSQLTEEPAAPQPGKALPADTWRDMAANLKAAQAKVEEARDAIAERREGNSPQANRWRDLGELVQDVERECQNLELRALVLARREGDKHDREQEERGNAPDLKTAAADAINDAAEAIRAAAEARRKAAEAERDRSRFKLEAEQAERAGGEYLEAFEAKLAKSLAPKQKRASAAEDTPSGLLRSASGTLETARKKLSSTPNQTTSFFLDELDRLSEMILDVSQQSAHLEDTPNA